MDGNRFQDSATDLTLIKYLTFMVADSTYAVPVKDVREIIGSQISGRIKIGSRRPSEHLINYRGSLIETVDLHERFGHQRKYSKYNSHLLVMGGVGERRPELVLIVDEIGEVIEWGERGRTGNGDDRQETGGYIVQTVTTENGEVHLLDIEKLL